MYNDNKDDISNNKYEFIERFRSLEEWLAWTKKNPFVYLKEYSQKQIEQIQSLGIINPLTQNHYSSDQILIQHDNYRETIVADNLISRHRALLFELKYLAQSGMQHLLTQQTKIYAPEAITNFALFLRGMFPRFLGSEFAETEAEREMIYPIPSENLTSLSFKNNVFDLVISNDVFEHVTDIDQCLREITRILNNSGALISTFPFAFNSELGIIKARLTHDEQIEYLTAPEYHGNPMKPNEGCLVFEIPAWNIINRAMNAGFKDAYVLFISSAKYGIMGQGVNGTFIFVAMKNIL